MGDDSGYTPEMNGEEMEKEYFLFVFFVYFEFNKSIFFIILFCLSPFLSLNIINLNLL